MHGHEDLSRAADDSVVIERADGNVVASAKLREIRTVFRIGGSRLTVAKLLAAEIGVILTAAALLCGLLLLGIDLYSGALVRALLLG